MPSRMLQEHTQKKPKPSYYDHKPGSLWIYRGHPQIVYMHLSNTTSAINSCIVAHYNNDYLGKTACITYNKNTIEPFNGELALFNSPDNA